MLSDLSFLTLKRALLTIGDSSSKWTAVFRYRRPRFSGESSENYARRG